MKLREVLKSDITGLILRWRYGPFVLIAILAVLHVLLGYELVTGQMRLRWRFEWIEGRESSPLLYWLYIAGSAGVLLLIDGYFLWSAFIGGRKKEADPDRQRTTRRM
jgi:hypothetical protein